MTGPYQTVLTSIIAATVLSISILIYIKIYPKRKISYPVLLFLIALLPLVSIFRFGTYESGDFNIHVYRTISFYEAMQDGQWLPSWPKDLNATYGYPLFIWLNSLPYYAISLLHLTGFSFIMSTKLFLAFSYLLSGLTFFLFARKQTSNRLAVFAGTIFYLFAPYHFVDLHIRAAIGETLAFAILPLFMLCIQLLWEKQDTFHSVMLGVVWGSFIFSHHAIAVFSLGFGTVYLLFLYLRNKNFSLKLVGLYCFSLIYGFLFSIYVWLPHVAMAKYTYGPLLQNTQVSFLHFWEFFYSPWRYGLLFQGPNGELSFLVGYLHLMVIALAVFFLAKKWRALKTTALVFYLIMTFLLAFMMLPISNSIWDSLPLVRSAQFSTRLMLLMAFSVSMLGVFVFNEIKNKTLIWIIVIFAILSTILNWGHRRVIPEIDDFSLKQMLWASTYQGEGFFGLGMPKWTRLDEMWIKEKPQSHIEILKGIGTANLIKRNSIFHEYKLSANTPLLVRENTAMAWWENMKLPQTTPSMTE